MKFMILLLLLLFTRSRNKYMRGKKGPSQRSHQVFGQAFTTSVHHFARSAALAARAGQNSFCRFAMMLISRALKSSFTVSQNRNRGRPRPRRPPSGTNNSTSQRTVSSLLSMCPVHLSLSFANCKDGRPIPTHLSASTQERWQSCGRNRTRLTSRKQYPSRQRWSRFENEQYCRPYVRGA